MKKQKKETLKDFLAKIEDLKNTNIVWFETGYFWKFISGDEVGMIHAMNKGLDEDELKIARILQKYEKNYFFSMNEVENFFKKVYQEKNDFKKIEKILEDCNGKRDKKYCFNSAFEVFEKKIKVLKKIKSLKVKKSSLDDLVVEVKSNYEEFPKAYKYSINLNMVTFSYRKGVLTTEKIEIKDQNYKESISMSNEAKQELMQNLFNEKIGEIK